MGWRGSLSKPARLLTSLTTGIMKKEGIQGFDNLLYNPKIKMMILMLNIVNFPSFLLKINKVYLFLFC